MKNKKYFMIGLVALSGVMMTAGCADFLDTDNKTAGGMTDDAYFSKHPESLLTTAFGSLRTLATNVELQDQGTDLYIPTRGKTPGDFNEYTLNPETSSVESWYTKLYVSVNYANGVEKYGTAGTTTVSEAIFLRAYAYYLLTQHFGSVPYITNYVTDATNNYPTAPLSEIYASEISRLESLYNNSSLPATAHDGHISKQAVAALLSYYYLASGWDLGTTVSNYATGSYTVNSTSDFTQAAAWAEKAINNVALTMSFEDKWSPSNEGNAEEIWSVQYDREKYPGDIATGGHNLQGSYGGYFGNSQSSGLKASGSDNAQSLKSLYLFGEGDTRWAGTFMQYTHNNWGKASEFTDEQWYNQGYYGYYNNPRIDTVGYSVVCYPYYVTEAAIEAEIAANPDRFTQGGRTLTVKASLLSNPVVVYTFKRDGSYSKSTETLTLYNSKTENGTTVKKFDDPKTLISSTSSDYRDIVIFHVSQMHLVAAEAYLLAGQEAQALAKVNAVRNRAGAPALASFGAYDPDYSYNFTLRPIDVILDESARECYAERTRWTDLRRTRQLALYNSEFNESLSATGKASLDKGEKWYRPIPLNAYNYNKGLTDADQNPGY